MSEEITPEEAFGSGISLTSSDDYGEDGGVPWDIDTSNGDIATVSGSANLRNCLAFTTVTDLSPRLAEPLTVDVLADVESQIVGILQQDDRVKTVEDVGVEFGETRPGSGSETPKRFPGDEIEIRVAVVGDDENRHELVFTSKK